MTMKERPMSRWEVADEATSAFLLWLFISVVVVVGSVAIAVVWLL